MSRAERDMSADAGGVRLFRNLKTGGFWRSDPGHYAIDRDTWLRDEAGDAYIAYPAAHAAAMERVVEAAVRRVKAQRAFVVLEVKTQAGLDAASDAYEAAIDDFDIAVDAYLSTLPRAHGGEGGGA